LQQQEVFAAMVEESETGAVSPFPSSLGDAEQHERSQHSPLFPEKMAKQKGLTWPFGQRQTKCGVPAISVMTAVNQMAPV
jgi:hypothetical protein